MLPDTTVFMHSLGKGVHSNREELIKAFTLGVNSAYCRCSYTREQCERPSKHSITADAENKLPVYKKPAATFIKIKWYSIDPAEKVSLYFLPSLGFWRPASVEQDPVPCSNTLTWHLHGTLQESEAQSLFLISEGASSMIADKKITLDPPGRSNSQSEELQQHMWWRDHQAQLLYGSKHFFLINTHTDCRCLCQILLVKM